MVLGLCLPAPPPQEGTGSPHTRDLGPAAQKLGGELPVSPRASALRRAFVGLGIIRSGHSPRGSAGGRPWLFWIWSRERLSWKNSVLQVPEISHWQTSRRNTWVEETGRDGEGDTHTRHFPSVRLHGYMCSHSCVCMRLRASSRVCTYVYAHVYACVHVLTCVHACVCFPSLEPEVTVFLFPSSRGSIFFNTASFLVSPLLCAPTCRTPPCSESWDTWLLPLGLGPVSCQFPASLPVFQRVTPSRGSTAPGLVSSPAQWAVLPESVLLSPWSQ